MKMLPNEKRIFYLLIIIALVSVFFIPTLYIGDGSEYFGILVSLYYHGSLELTDQDVIKGIEILNDFHFDEKKGYFPALSGRLYSFHFWMYPLVCYPVFLLLQLFHCKLLSVFIITNTLLMLLLCWWILFKVNNCLRYRLCLLSIALINPILLYVPWSHPEVYIYVFVFIGLLEFMEKRFFLSLFLLCFASLQAPPLLLIPGIITLYLIAKKIIPPQKYWRLAVANAIGLLPMAFYWFHYGTWSLLAASGVAKLEYMSWTKVINLLFDPNFGLVIYYPILFAVILFQVFIKDRLAIYGLGIMLLIVFSMTSQVNWNPGVMYISRYAVWLIPIVIVVVCRYLAGLKNKSLAAILAGYLLTTGIFTVVCAYEYRWDNAMSFLPQTRWLLRHAPAFYNPPFKVFVERAIGQHFNDIIPIETQIKDFLPIQLYDQDGLRKELALNSRGELEYRNGGAKWHSGELYCFSNLPNQFPQISLHGITDPRTSFGTGWYKPENDNQGYFWRWMATRSSIGLIAPTPADAVAFDMQIRSYFRPRQFAVYLNGTKVFEKEISTLTHISFQGNLRKGINSLTFVSREPAESPRENLESLDSRRLTFAIGQDLQ